ELDLRPVFRRLAAAWVRVAAVTIAAGAIGVLLAIVLPKWYRASAVILPPEETDLLSNLGVMGRALSKFPALGEFGEYSTPADIYKAILESRTVKDDLIDRFHLVAVYHAKTREVARKVLTKLSSVKLNPDGTIAVSVEDRDPKRAAAMAAAMVQG